MNELEIRFIDKTNTRTQALIMTESHWVRQFPAKYIGSFKKKVYEDLIQSFGAR